MALVSNVSTAIAYFMIVVVIGVALLLFAVWLANISANFFNKG